MRAWDRELLDVIDRGAVVGWRIEGVPSAGILHTVAAAGSGAWACGIAVREAGEFATLVFRRGERGWEQAQAPQVGRVNRVLAVSDTDVWAVGDGSSLHWDGSQWREVATARIEGSEPQFFGLAQFGGDDVWTAGSAPLCGRRQARGTVQRWDGTAWTDLPVPEVAAVWSLSGIAGVSPADVWAVGRIHGAQGQALALHWDGREWEPVPVPSAGGRPVYLSDVAVLDGGDVWAAGYSHDSGGIGTRRLFTVHWDGRAWSAGRIPSSPGQVSRLATDGTRLWGIGYAPPGVPLAASLDGQTWQVLAGPPGPARARHTSLHGAAVLRDGCLLAVGASSMPDSSSQPLAAVLDAGLSHRPDGDGPQSAWGQILVLTNGATGRTAWLPACRGTCCGWRRDLSP